MRLIICLLIIWLALPSPVSPESITGSEQLEAKGVHFGWSDVRSRSLRIVVEYRYEGEWKRATLGTGFLISPEGLFVSAYHVMKYCLQSHRQTSGFSVNVDCSSANGRVRYKAQNGDDEYDIEVLSHLTEEDSTNGKDHHSPDEIIKNRDFVIGKLKGQPMQRFPYWPVRDFRQGTINVSNPSADFELKPLLPPKRVFVAGYPQNRGFQISSGFLNLADDKHRGYFAADYKVYPKAYLERQGIPPETQWGMRVENQMSGGPVIDSAGYVVGVVVNGNSNTAGVLSIENVLETFFSRVAEPGARHSVTLAPTQTPLYLKGSSTH